MDIGFSNDAQKYYDAKKNHYKDFKEGEVGLIIFQKDCSILPQSLEFLSRFSDVLDLDSVYTYLGNMLA